MNTRKRQKDTKEWVEEIFTAHPDWNARQIHDRYSQMVGPRDAVGLSSVQKYLEEIKPKYTDQEKEADAPWQLGYSKPAEISIESIPWLMELQVCRKSYYSKPITFREAKWFSRLSGFRQTFSGLPDFLAETEIRDEKIRNNFLSHVIATWAKLYSYREKLDTIAGVMKPDYSDLDSYLATNSLKGLDQYNDKWSWISLKRIANKDEISKEDLEKFNTRYMMSSNIDNVRSREIFFLAHSLGDPDMSDNAIDLYSRGLDLVLLDFDGLNKRLIKLAYIQRIKFLVYMRQWVNEHLDDHKDIMVSLIKIIDKVEKENAKQ
jgi:hypothetical protein